MIMSLPYRDTTNDDDAAEPMPKFRDSGSPRRAFLVRGALALIGMLVAGIAGGIDEALKVLLLYGLPVLLSAFIIFVAEQPVRRWFERRHARQVARGITRLEARAAMLAVTPRAH